MNNRYIFSSRRFASIALVVCALLPAAAFALAPLTLDADTPSRISGYDWYEIFIDDTGAHSLADILRADPGFVTASAERVNLGFTHQEIWAHFSLRFAPGSRRSMMLMVPKPLLDEVELYAVFSDGRTVRSLTGDAQPWATRSRPWRAFSFELSAAPGEQVDYYVRARSPTSALSLPLILRDAAGFERFTQIENFFLGGYFGVMVALAIASILVFATFRRRIFLNYFLYITAFTTILACVSGYGMQFIWAQDVGLQQYLPTLSVAATMLAGVLFVREFLDLKRRSRALDRMMLIVAGGGVLGATYFVLTAAQSGVIAVIACALVLCVLAFMAFIRSIAAGDTVVGYFMVGWFACVVGITAAALDMYGLIPSSVVSAYGMYFGSFAEFAAISIALGTRLRRSQMSKEAQIAAAGTELTALNQNLENMVQHRTRELQDRNRELSELAIRDSLTGLYNHSTSIELLDQILHQSHRYDFAVTVLMADIDHFKQINDSYGHQVGDSVLEIVSQTLLDSVRDSDIVGRYGGEEFLIVMPHADALAAREFGERLLRYVRETEIPQSGERQLSVSLGVAVYNPRGQRVSAAALIQRADIALYRSKRSGRDRLTIDSLSIVDAAAGDGVGAPAAPA